MQVEQIVAKSVTVTPDAMTATMAAGTEGRIEEMAIVAAILVTVIIVTALLMVMLIRIETLDEVVTEVPVVRSLITTHITTHSNRTVHSSMTNLISSKLALTRRQVMKEPLHTIRTQANRVILPQL